MKTVSKKRKYTKAEFDAIIEKQSEAAKRFAKQIQRQYGDCKSDLGWAIRLEHIANHHHFEY